MTVIVAVCRAAAQVRVIGAPQTQMSKIAFRLTITSSRSSRTVHQTRNILEENPQWESSVSFSMIEFTYLDSPSD
jgi:hypothetical protein